MKSLRELYATPDFQKLSFEEQQDVKNEWFRRTVETRPDLQRLSQEDAPTFNALAEKVMKTPPALRGYNPLDITDEERAAADSGSILGERAGWIKGVRLYERLSENPNDPALQQEAALFVTENSAANESLLFKVWDEGMDFVEKLVGVKEGTISRGGALSFPLWAAQEIGKAVEGSKANKAAITPNTRIEDRDDFNRLVSAMAATGRTRAASPNDALGVYKGLAEFGTGFVETIALSGLTFGSGNVVSAAQNGGKAVVGTPGLFTKGIFGAEGIFSKLAAGAQSSAASGFWKHIAPQVAESVGGGLVDAFRAVPDILQKSDIQGEKNFWQGFAGTFGQGVAYDLAFNAVGGVVRTALKPFVRVFRGINPGNAKGLEELAQRGSDLDYVTKNMDPIARSILGNVQMPPGAEGLSKDVYDEILKRQAQSVVWTQIKDFSFTNPKALAPLARAVADLDFDDLGNGTYRLAKNGFEKTVGSVEDAVYEIFAQGSIRKTIADELMDDVFSSSGKPSPVGGNPLAQFRSLAKMRNTSLKKASTELLVSQIPLASAGDDLFESQVKGVTGRLLKNHGISNAEELVKLMPQNLLRPAAMQTPAAELFYFKNLDDWVRKVGGEKTTKMGSLTDAFLQNPERSLSASGLDAAARRMLPNGSFEPLGQNQFRVSFRPEGQEAVSKTFTGLRSANDWLGEQAVAAGLVSEKEIADQFLKQTGMKIEWQEELGDSLGQKVTRSLTNEWGQPIYRVRRPDGTLQDSTFSSMLEVVRSQPGFMFKLPDSLAPEIVFDNNGAAWYSKTILAAPMSSARKILDGFVSGKGTPVEIHFDGEIEGKAAKISTIGRIGQYEVEIPSVGFRRAFDTPTAAMKFLKDQSDSFDLLQTLAHERGFKVEFSKNGSAFVRDVASAKLFSTNTRADIEDFLKQYPDASSFTKSLFDLEDQVDPDGALASKISKLLGDSDNSKPVGDISLENMGSSFKALSDKESIKKIFSPARDIKHAVMQTVMPRHEALREMSKDFDIPEVASHVRNVQTLSGVVSRYSTTAQQWIKKIAYPGGKKASRLERKVAWALVQNAPDAWDGVLGNMAKSIKGLKGWTPDEVIRIKQLALSTNQFLNAWGKHFGIDGYDFVQHYIPKLRNIKAVAAEYGFDDNAKKAVLDKLMGGAAEGHRPLQFFAKNGRLNDLVQLGEVDDVVSLMSTYAEMGLREKYLGPAIDSLDKFMKESRGSVPQVVTDTLEGFRALARGGTTSGSERTAQTLSLSISTSISDGLRKLTGMIGDPRAAENWDLWAKDLITTDLPGKAGNLISYATLGFRPWRGLSNMMQFHLNVMPIYGGVAYDAQGMVDPAYIKRCFDLGLITDKVLAANELASPTTSKLLNAGLSPQQSSEYLVRAWTAKTAEIQYREGVRKLSEGILDEDGFLKYSKAYLLAEPDQKAFMNMVKEGKLDGAQHMLQRQIIDLTMFNYEKTNRPQMMTGVIGKMFGKFGVYPIGQVNLYRKVLTSDSWAQRAVTFARFAAISSIVYNAFRAAGVDYSGFRMQDPFSFSGGPLFTTGMDLLKAKSLLADPENQEGKQAYSRFMRNWSFVGADGGFNVPRLAVPGYLQLQGMTEGASMFYEGQYYQGVLRGLLGAPIDNDVFENGFKWK